METKIDVLSKRYTAHDTSCNRWIDEIHVQLVFVTPQIASTWLKSSDGNYRTLQKPHKRKMVTDMVSGNWSFTNATIAFDINKKLVDGQHRLSAVVESGTSQWFLVVAGMPDGSQKNPAIDTGARRRVSTHLHNEGVANANIVASAARLLYRLRDGKIYRSGTQLEASDTKVAQIIKNTPSIIDAASAICSCRKIVKPSVVTAWYWLVSKENQDLADECVAILGGNRESSTLHPFAKCREVFLQASADKKSEPIKAEIQLRYLMSAWQKALTGSTVKLLRPVNVLKIPDAADSELQRLA